MLSIFYGDMPEVVYYPVVYFKNTYSDDWITDDLSREMIRDVDRSQVVSARIIDSPVLGGRAWKAILSTIHDSIVFIDEDNAFLPTNDFAEAVRDSDNYYVIITREGLPNLPYSVTEIYGIRESGKYASLQQTYNEMYRIYGN